MAKQPIIPLVKTRKEKGETYRVCMEKHKKAMAEGFYFEALLIDYAMIEDRLRSFLWHAGAFNRWEDNTKFCRMKASRELKELIEANADKLPKRINLNRISDKIKCVRAILKWAEKDESGSNESQYVQALREQCKKLDGEKLKQTLDELDEWKKERNEIIHSLLNKAQYGIDGRAQRLAEEGLKIGREMDAQVRILKKGDKIRKAAQMQS